MPAVISAVTNSGDPTSRSRLWRLLCLRLRLDCHTVHVNHLAAEPSGDAQQNHSDHREPDRPRSVCGTRGSKPEVYREQSDYYQVSAHVPDAKVSHPAF